MTRIGASSDGHRSSRGGLLRPGLRSARPLLSLAAVAVLVASCGSDAPARSAASTTAAPAASSSPTTSPPSTLEAPPLSTSATTTPSAGCERLTDFDTADGWVVVNDGVMGGRSAGAIEFSDSTLRFSGNVVTAGGGFTSVRLPLFDTELADSDSLELRLRADERTYGLTLEDAAQTGRRAISHRADLTVDGPIDPDGWQTVELSYNDLQPSVFGQPLDAPPFDPNQATEIGIIISDGIDGNFALEVDWIDACRNR